MSFDTRIKHKRDTASNWELNNPVLLNGELIIVDTNAGGVRFKIGDGTKTYTQLPFQDESLYNVLSNKANSADLEALSERVLPEVTSADEGKFLVVQNGKWSSITVTNGNEVSY